MRELAVKKRTEITESAKRKEMEKSTLIQQAAEVEKQDSSKGLKNCNFEYNIAEAKNETNPEINAIIDKTESITDQEMDNKEKEKIQEDREKLTENTPEVRQEVND